MSKETSPISPVYYINNNVCYENNYDKKNFLNVCNGDSIHYRYEIIQHIGKGVFGNVYEAKDHKRKHHVALKIIKHDPKFHKYAKIETEMYDIMYKNKGSYSSNVIKLYKSFLYNGDVFLVFKLYGKNLFNYYNNNSINDDDMKSISYQIASGLGFIHSHNIIHMDLKPENILIHEKKIKIIDLGSAFIKKPRLIRSYVQTRYYRSPEVIYELNLDTSMDIWSYGCILYELIERKILTPAKTHDDLVVYYNHICGSPPKYMFEIYNSNNYDIKNMTLTNGNRLNVDSFSWYYENNNLKNLIFKCCLQWDSKKRLTSKEILNHDYFYT